MNFILLLVIVPYFCVLGVNCRSVHLHSDTRSLLEVTPEKDANHDTESSGIFSWIRLKPFLRREVQLSRNIEDEINKFNEGSMETTSLVPSKENQTLLTKTEGLNTNEKTSPKIESPVTNTSTITLALAEHKHNTDSNIGSNGTRELISNITHAVIQEMDSPLIANDLPDNVISDILNQSVDSIFLQTLNDNSSNNIDSIEFDETALLSDGGHVLAMLQEVSTIGFELLIDSETKKNSVLAELLNSQSNLIDDDDLSFASTQLNHGNESELQEVVTNEETTGNPDVELSTDDVITENSEFGSDEYEIADTEFGSDEYEIVDIEFGSDEDKIADTEFGSDEDKIADTEFALDEDKTKDTELESNEDTEFGSNEDKTESTEFGSNEDKTESTEFGLDKEKAENTDFGSDENKTEDTELTASEMQNVKNESQFLDSIQDEKVTEISNIEPEHPKCPDPGWCIFWFMALDLCAKDAHCHGSLLCCTIGCSKTCVDADNELL